MDLWDQLVAAVCRPPRDDAYTEADLVGGRRASFRLYDRRYYRLDVQLENKRGQKLQASHYRPCVVTSSDGRLPCVAYCHCNSGSRRDAEEILYHCLPRGMTVMAFDFAGSGLSEGSYVTLGAFEVDDLAAVVQYLRDEGSTSTIGLWGRSMGAVTALLYSQRDPGIAGMVLDSPFSRLVDLMMELATDQQLRVPKPLLKVALAMLKRSVRRRAGFSVDAVAPLDVAGACFTPAQFGHAQEDTFVARHHSERLYAAYAGDKSLVTFEGDHNSVRPDHFYDSSVAFLHRALRVEELVGPSDLQALPEEQLPHLRAPSGSIYVTASRDLAGELAEAEAEGSAASSSPRSPDSGGGGGEGGGLARTMSRTLSPPWALRHNRGAPNGRRPPDVAAMLSSLSAEAEAAAQGGGAGGGEAWPAGLAEGMAGLGLSEEEALQLALEASLADAAPQRQAQGARQAGAQPESREDRQLASGDQPAGAEEAPAEDGGAPAGGGGVEAPRSTEEEEAMLAAALAASLEQQAPAAAAADAAAAAAAEPAAQADAEPAGKPAVEPAAEAAVEPAAEAAAEPAAEAAAALGGGPVAAGVSEGELRYYYGSTRPAWAAAAQGGHAPVQSGEQGDSTVGGGAAQGAAGAHAAAEAAAVLAPSARLQQVLGGAAAAAAAGGGEARGGSPAT